MDLRAATAARIDRYAADAQVHRPSGAREPGRRPQGRSRRHAGEDRVGRPHAGAESEEGGGGSAVIWRRRLATLLAAALSLAPSTPRAQQPIGSVALGDLVQGLGVNT